MKGIKATLEDAMKDSKALFEDAMKGMKAILEDAVDSAQQPMKGSKAILGRSRRQDNSTVYSTTVALHRDSTSSD